jgi:hypothetical protein
VKVVIKTIPNNSQRYETIGDWWYDKDGTLQIRISEFDEPRHSMAVALHELFEAFAATNNKHTEEEVTKFDLWFEDQLKEEKVPDSLDEPGMHPKCPYNLEHQYGTAAEMILLTLLGCNWWEYEEAVTKMSREQKIKKRKVDKNGNNKNG